MLIIHQFPCRLSGVCPVYTVPEGEGGKCHEMAWLQLQKTKKRHWIPDYTGSPITNVGDKRREL